MFESYVHNPNEPAIQTPITAICGIDDRAIDLADMQLWKGFTQGIFRLRSFPGDHFFPIPEMERVLELASWGIP